MKNNSQPGEEETTPLSGKSPGRLGFWTSIAIAIISAVAFGFGITTPARSGPNYVSGPYITYPYTDVAQFVPRDYIWMYPAFLMALLFILLIVCIHHYADKGVFGNIAVSFAVISAAALSFDYFIQLTVMQPSLLKGEVEGLSLFSQYNPHGIFIALEDVGYFMMGTSFLSAAAIFTGRKKLERAIRFIFIASGVLSIGSLILLAALYRSNLDYRYEVAAITINWITLIVSGILLSVFFKRLKISSQ